MPLRKCKRISTQTSASRACSSPIQCQLRDYTPTLLSIILQSSSEHQHQELPSQQQHANFRGRHHVQNSKCTLPECYLARLAEHIFHMPDAQWHRRSCGIWRGPPFYSLPMCRLQEPTSRTGSSPARRAAEQPSGERYSEEGVFIWTGIRDNLQVLR